MAGVFGGKSDCRHGLPDIEAIIARCQPMAR